MNAEKAIGFQNVMAKLMRSKDTGEDVILTGEEVMAFFEFAAGTIYKQKEQKEKDFDEFPFAQHDKYCEPEIFEAPEIAKPIFQVKFFHDESIEVLETKLNEFCKNTKHQIFGILGVQPLAIGYSCTALYQEEFSMKTAPKSLSVNGEDEQHNA